MPAVTDFRCVDERDDPILCDAFGNNVAFRCPDCGHPVLAVIREHQRGASPANPAKCRHCEFRGWIVTDIDRELLTLNRLDGKLSSPRLNLFR